MEYLTLSLFVVVISIVILCIDQAWRKKDVNTGRLPLPPGPRKLPIIGNALDFPSQYPWAEYATMARIYGDVIHMDVFGQSVIILGSAEAASDLLEKRSSKYSSRPQLPMLRDLLGWAFTFVLMPYGDEWRRHRRDFHQLFLPSVIGDYHPVQLQSAHDFIRRLAETPDNLYNHIRHVSAASILSVAYGFQITEDDDFSRIAEEAMQGFATAAIPGAFLVDIFPILKYVPSWMPGASFKRKAMYWRSFTSQMASKPWGIAKDAINSGSAKPCIAVNIMDHLANKGASEEEEIMKRDMLGTTFGAASDTSSAAVYLFFLAMLRHPDIQRKAHIELDRVVGPARLPVFEDRTSLPYIEAIISEVLRWQPLAPLAIPHFTSENDEYRGYFIPKNSIVIANSWNILSNSMDYPEPEKFQPERFLKDGQINPAVKDPRTAAYGYGRRICPGRHYADANLFIIFASVLHVFDITPKSESDCYEKQISFEDMTSGVVSMPKPFRCSITPRHAAAIEAIRKAAGNMLAD